MDKQRTAEGDAEALGASISSVRLLATRHKVGKLKVGPDGRTYRVFSDLDIEFLRSRIGKRGRPSKEPNVARTEEPVEDGTSLGPKKASGSMIQGVLRPGKEGSPQTFP